MIQCQFCGEDCRLKPTTVIRSGKVFCSDRHAELWSMADEARARAGRPKPKPKEVIYAN